MAAEVISSPIAARVRLWARWTVRATFILLTACLVAIAALMVTGHRALIVRSGSMAPSIQAGDIVVSKVVRPGDVGLGDVITFRDPSRLDVLVTHRVARIRVQGDSVAFVTRGDRNGGVERWSVDAAGTVGRVVLRIPNAGFWLSWATTPGTRLALLVGAAVLLSAVALWRIWRREAR